MLTERKVSRDSRRGTFATNRSDVITGLKNVRESTGFHGRLELVRKRPKMIVDVAHNAEAANRLVEALENLSLRNLILVFGVMKDKNYSAMLESLSRVSAQVIAVAPKMERALDSKVIAETVQRLGMRALDAGSVKRGVVLALKKAGASATILITGSHFVVGEALQAIRPR
jgi:dihydrofolate synthase/folylpolyglutamate synthase